MSFENRLKELNIVLPKAADPVGSYVAAKISGKLLYISGQISMDENGQLIKGKLGKDLDTEAGYNAAKRCALSIIAQVKKDSLYEDLKLDLENALLKSKPSKELDLLTYKKEIVEFLENEIVSRYYYRKGKVINSFKYDEVVKEAISLFKDMQKFNEILGE